MGIHSKNTGTKGINDSCRELLEATTGKNLPTRHNEGGLPSPELILPHPYARVPVFSPFKSFLSGDFGRKKCRDPYMVVLSSCLVLANDLNSTIE